jgi:amphi-Trp domain-containing protein
VADVEIKRKIRLSREPGGRAPDRPGQGVDRRGHVRAGLRRDSLRFKVADEVDWELELEIDGDEIELEIELKWSDAKPAAPAPAASQTPPVATPAAAAAPDARQAS